MEPYELTDNWFRHAETIGQARLNNFLMSGSILFIACTALLSLDNQSVAAWLCMFVSSLGLVLSMFWVVLGLRQLKFHKLLELQLAEDLNQLSETEKKTHVVARLYALRKSESPITIGESVLQLTRIEYMASSRWFLVFVPLAFGIAYVAFIFASVYILKCIT